MPDINLFTAVNDIVVKQERQTEINRMIVKGILSGEISFHGSDTLVRILNGTDSKDSKDK